jgi:hypothetical protein
MEGIQLKAIHPKKKFDAKAVMATLEEAFNEASKEALLDFELTTATWNHQVKFDREVTSDQSRIRFFVGTDDEIYFYVFNKAGTKPHIIRAKRAKVLVFPSAFTPKTTPGKITASRGSKGGPTVITPQVMHPGTKSRYPTIITIRKRHKPLIVRRMKAAMKSAAKASGHSI